MKNNTGLGEVKRTKAKHVAMIMAKPNVIGVGAGFRQRGGRVTNELCVVALVQRKLPQAGLTSEEMVPAELDGVPTDVLQVGLLRAEKERTERWRPAPGGVSIGHFQVTAGTLGCVVRDRATGARLILSNNHVLAKINAAMLGDPILQPGAIDGGREGADTIAVLERFYPVRFGVETPSCGVASLVSKTLNLFAGLVGSKHRLRAYREDPAAVNQIDAAVARPMDQNWISDEILEIGLVEGVRPATLGMAVRKSGRSTGLTRGEIQVLDATTKIDYDGNTALFEGQLLSTPMSQPGDSGSLLVAGDSPLAVGLLFAGSQQATVFNPIQAVLEKMEVLL